MNGFVLSLNYLIQLLRMIPLGIDQAPLRQEKTKNISPEHSKMYSCDKRIQCLALNVMTVK